MAFQPGWPTGRQLADNCWVQGTRCSRSHRCSELAVPRRDMRTVHIIRVSANGAEKADPGDSNDDAKKISRQVDPGAAKEKLLRILTELINDESQIQEVEKLILQLESLRATPITDVFTELGLAGNWKLVFSSTRTRTTGTVRIRQIGQTFDTENKQMINKASWSFAAKNGVDHIKADLSVVCSYKFVGPGRLQVSVEEHKIKILENEKGPKAKLPDDLQALLRQLQLSLPIEFFDPSGLIDVSYMEPNFRLARFMGKRIAGVRNVFIRDQNE